MTEEADKLRRAGELKKKGNTFDEIAQRYDETLSPNNPARLTGQA